LPASFTRLRIAGFKSFAEPVTLDVLPGLTGIVGPNGCGKSNVVEALRWAMGESSARSLRGTDMDDVIFAGTSQRAARNLADVTLVLEDTKSLAPPPFHELDTLEISRRIERGGGSAYRINGREARARDVQTLFADLASGARASAMVSQGRVGALVSAKPEDRRSILEEAAGITGLHARRHEAELKLRAAETNLARAEDLRGQLETQLEALKRQARQAARYRVISATIRNAESELLSLQNARAEAARGTAQAAVTQATREVAVRAKASVAATAAAEDAALSLPTLRSAEATARTALERHRLGLEQIASEIARARAGLEAATQQVTRLQSDLAHANRQAIEAEQAIARLDAESAQIASADAAHPALAESAATEAATAADAVRALESDVNRATEHAAEIAARHRALTETLSQADQRARKLRDQLFQLSEDQTRLHSGLVPPERLTEAQEAAAAAQTAHESARTELESADRQRAAAFAEAATLRECAQLNATNIRAETRKSSERLRAEAAQRLAVARTAAHTTDATRAKIASEHQALAEILRVKDNERWPRMVDQLTVPDGLEAALGAALGEELDSAADAAAARHWRDLPPFSPPPTLPKGATALSALVQSPPALTRALSQIGLIDNATDAVLTELKPGQMLISRHGAVWRWDGYTVRPGTQTAAAVRLQQRRRLSDLAKTLATAQQQATDARIALAEAETAERTARTTADTAEQTSRAEADRAEAEARIQAKSLEEKAADAERQAHTARTSAEAALTRTRAAAATLESQSTAATARGAGLAEQHARIATDAAEAEAALAAVKSQTAELPNPEAARTTLTALRETLAAARTRDKTASQTHDTLARTQAIRQSRRQAIGPEAAEWRARDRDAADRQSDLTARLAAAQSEAIALQEAPIRLAEQGRAATATLSEAEAHHTALATRLATAESTTLSADRAARTAEAHLAAAREHAVRADGEMVQANHAWGTIAERILERLGATPDLPAPPTDIGPDSEDKHRRRHERLIREREDMGPVNLRAEIEAAFLEEQIATIVRDREEIATAIAKLRGSIGHLNREGRERLTTVFTQVDAHFQTLFARMFGGGRAHLALVGSDDPLTAGLEIYAQPPGKKLSALSLLSGGEQALTALSLIFAVFRCNPAPICVLDEVDAPLDDANVDRFCTLLEDMVRETNTRFLVVTHHAHTMARMDRLYGVTMQERGVSRVLSVDLARAAEMVDAIAAE
jgi:chromosome segregation protein